MFDQYRNANVSNYILTGTKYQNNASVEFKSVINR